MSSGAMSLGPAPARLRRGTAVRGAGRLQMQAVPPPEAREDARLALTGLSDGDLLVAYAAGQEAAAQLLTERLVPRVYAQAMRMLADRAEAEDVAQDAMLKLWQVAPDWREGEAQVTTWLYRVTANLCIDRLRRRRRTAPLEAAAEPPDPAPGAAERLQGAARNRALSEALASLPERQARAVALRHLEGLGNPEIAGIMDIGVEAVESLTARGKRALARLLSKRRAELGYEDE